MTTTKLAISPLTWYRHSLKGARKPFIGQSVPCGTCTQCCRGVEVQLVTGADDPTLYLLDPEATIPTLARQADGSCVYLRENLCTIYQYRPFVCRTFDCRAHLITDVRVPAHLYEAAAEKFEVVCKAPGDREWLERVRATVEQLKAQNVPVETLMYQALDAEKIAELRKRARR